MNPNKPTLEDLNEASKEIADGHVAITDSFLMLEGKKIIRVNVHGVNCVSLEMSDGSCYMLNTECVFPTLQLYGMVCEECPLEDIRAMQ